MARIRTIKPEFFLHEELHDLECESSLPVRLSFVGLWCVADREGRFHWRPRTLKASILPFCNTDFSRVLDALLTRGFIVKYVSDMGEEYGCIPSFSKHQVINNREKASTLPDINECEIVIPLQDVDACGTREQRVVDFVKGKGKERKELAATDKPSRPAVTSDEEWLLSLAEDLAYKHVNVKIEFSKMTRWCEMNKKQPSRKRFINWLNRIEAPLSGHSADGKIWDATGMTNMEQQPDGSYRKLLM